ncbi:alpha/beta fold hydrolase [Endozoicomonas sp.]|uniref:alpha/beta fold hydrolase n=1 Tax=Endozoicomonas sp. TaxID=1892382 RepID=UPI00383A7DC2
MSQYPIVLISGWAMPAGVMEALAEALDADHRRVSIVELPGLVMESEANKIQYDWDSLLQYLDQQLFEKPIVLVGWSLGGMLATLYASRYPDKVAGVVNLAVNGCFVKRHDWPDAMDPSLFTSFYEGMAQSCKQTLQEFSLLCSAGSARRKEQARTLQALMADADFENQAQGDTLLRLLALLGKSDIRSALADIRCPVTHLFGQDDALVPVTAAHAIEQQFPRHRVNVVAGGHGFFMDDPASVVREIQTLLPEKESYPA